MTRRGLTLTVAGALLLVTTLAVVMLPLPFVVKRPGATENTLGSCPGPGGDRPIVRITGGPTYAAAGHLELTSVTVNNPQWQYSSRMPDMVRAWVSDEQVLEQHRAEYPPTISSEQAQQQSTAAMLGSQDSASAAALGLLGAGSVRVVVAGTEPGTPARGVLRKGDVLTEVDREPVAGLSAATEQISARPVGSTVTITYLRDGREQVAELRTEKFPGEPGRSRIGISVGERLQSSYDVSYHLCEDIGGPSAGLMFSLGIYDKLTPGSLTGGRFVAGTGEITAAGVVGPIGGIPEKMVAARELGATVFLAPAANCGEAMRSTAADDLLVVKVSDLSGAVRSLDLVRQGKQEQVPTCGMPGGAAT